MLHEDYLETANPDFMYPSDYEFLSQHGAAEQRKKDSDSKIEEAIENKAN